MKVSIIGITGFTGAALAQELLQRGHEVRGGARRTDGEAPVGVAEVVTVDIHRAPSLDALFDGADAVLVSVQPLAEGATLADALPDLLASAARHGARLGFVGGAGSLRMPDGTRLVDLPEFPAAWRPGAEAHATALDRLRASGGDADWFVASPSRSFGRQVPGERRGGYRVGTDELLVDATGESHIGVEDFAAAIVDELEDPRHRRARFTVGY